MNFKAGAALTLTLSVVLGLQISARARTQPDSRSFFVSAQDEDSLLNYLGSALRTSGHAGRLDYAGSCQKDSMEFVAFPRIAVSQPSGNLMALGAVQQIFRGDAGVNVAEEPQKIISVRVGEPSTAILQTRVSLLKISTMGRYNPAIVIGSVESTRELKTAMTKLGLRVPLQLSEQLLATPAPGLPHLPAEMKDVTVNQILNSIAVTFKGIVIYGTCTHPNGGGLIQIRFTGLEDGDEK